MTGPDRGLVTRRRFLASVGAFAVLGGCSGGQGGDDGGETQGAAPTLGGPTSSTPAGGSGSTAADGATAPALQPDGNGLALAQGFSSIVLSSSADGASAPALDGMGLFVLPDGTRRLVRNHERRDAPGSRPPLDAGTAYDPSAPGGTSTLVLATDGRSASTAYVTLSGTLANCAGGATPWGSWLTCEEATDGPEQGYDRPHGYVFEVPATADAPVTPTPLTAMGRFLHEAVAIDPQSGTVYLTEDNGYDSGLYRFLPSSPGSLAQGGALEMLAVAGAPEFDTSFGRARGTVLAITWVPIADPDPATAAVDTSAVFNQGLAAGGARFKRLEGCCWVEGTLFVSATEGGDAGLGQVWALDTVASTLRLVAESSRPDELFGPDNLTAIPATATDLVVCEDNGERNRLLVLGPDGELSAVVENVGDTTEFAGTTFDADGSTLYVNVYGDEQQGIPARTFAIWGQWAALR